MQKQTSTSTRATSIIHPFLDFWLLGGASVAIWLLMEGTGLIRSGNMAIELHYMQLGAAFTLLTLICNHPHFMISYQFGYGRGAKFILRHWFSLLAVPIGMIALFAFAYISIESPAATGMIVDRANDAFEFVGMGFRFGRQDNLGGELMNFGIWLMYFTVGWHYSKQVFGCMMVYASFNNYPLTSLQRYIVKGSVFSLALMQFAYLNQGGGAHGFAPTRLGAQPLTALELPTGLYLASIAASVLFFTATLVFVFGQIYRKTGRLPSANMLIPWIAFYVWWVPSFQVPEFTFMMVPFFHSLQYLPFAYRVGTPDFKRDNWYYVKITAHAAIILLIGFMAFEGLPAFLDQNFAQEGVRESLFFMTAFAVFINVHHFFIDSVAWKFKDQSLRAALFEVRDRRTAALVELKPRMSPADQAPRHDPDEARAL